MVNGEFKCLGSSQHLKNKFGEGFVLTVKLKRLLIEDREVDQSQEMFEVKSSVKNFVQESFINSVLK